MKISFVVNNYPPRMGGVENHVLRLARQLRDRGHTITIITLLNDVGVRDEEGITVHRFAEFLRIGDVLGIPKPGFLRKLIRILREQGTDVISVHTRFFPLTYLGIRAGRVLSIPVIHTEHGSGHVVSDSSLVTIASKFVDKTLGRYSVRAAAKVLAVSEESAQFIGKISGKPASVFYNAIDVDPSREPRLIREQARTVSPRPDLVFIGRMVAGKGWEDAVAAFTQLDAGLVGKLHLVGGGPLLDTARAHVESRGLSERVIIHGRVEPDRVRTLLAGNIYINPTVLAEGFQTTLLEAVAEGGQVATYPVPGAQRLAEQGAPVLITTPPNPQALADLISELATAPRPAMDRDALLAWSWERRAQEYEEICVEAVRSASPPRR